MTAEKLDAAIKEIVLLKEKSKSTGNSHSRKQWENRRNWRLCTIGKSCKIGWVKICSIAKQKPLKHRIIKSQICKECIFWCGRRLQLYSAGKMGKVYYWCDTGTHYGRYSHNCKELRIEINRRIRRYKGEIGNNSYYRKMFEYKWDCV